MKKQIYKDLPLEIDKIYETKFQTGEKFLLKEIVTVVKNKETKISMLKGIYVNTPHLGICPLNVDRLIPERIYENTVDVCHKCGTQYD